MAGPDLIASETLDLIRKRQADAAAAEAAIPRVIDIKTRERFVMKVAIKAKRVRKPKIDAESIKMVEGLLERLRAGTCEGVLFIVTTKEDGAFEFGFRAPPAGEAHLHATRYIGGLEIMKGDLIEMADYIVSPMTDEEAAEMAEHHGLDGEDDE